MLRVRLIGRFNGVPHTRRGPTADADTALMTLAHADEPFRVRTTVEDSGARDRGRPRLTVLGSEATPQPRGVPGPLGGFRPEIQGLRSIAVLMVVTYHIFLDRVSGGVDVFLMISAFLLTRSLVRRIESGHGIDLAAHWLHRFKRLIPAAAVTIVGALAATWAWLPESRWPTVLDQAWASLLYVQNWLLASLAVDYNAPDHSLSSPLQHFWSLSIQGQVFVLWPILLVVTHRLSRRFGTRYRTATWIVFALVFAASLTWSVVLTATNQPAAYFSTWTRLWEFAAGSLMALALPSLRFGSTTRVVLGWLGLLGVLSTGLVLPVAATFPGYAALWPIVSASLVIAAGQTGSPWGADRLLSARALVRLGGSSYALYLVHWPILVAFLVANGTDRVGVPEGLGLILFSIVTAELITRLVDRPIRNSAWIEARKWRMAATITAFALIVAVPTGLAARELEARNLEAREIEAREREARELEAGLAVSADHPGAASLREGFVFSGDPAAPPIPIPTDLDSQWWTATRPCTGRYAPVDEIVECRETKPSPDPARVIAVVGGSHAQQFAAALQPLAELHDWHVVAVLQGGCTFGAGGGDSWCAEWFDATWRYLQDADIDALFTVSTAAAQEGGGERLVSGYEELVGEMTARGVHVIGVRDNPRFPFDMYACAELYSAADARCRRPLAESLAPSSPAADLIDNPLFHNVDLTGSICPSGLCTALIGNVYVFLDDNHLTKAYAATLGRDLEEQLLPQLGW